MGPFRVLERHSDFDGAPGHEAAPKIRRESLQVRLPLVSGNATPFDEDVVQEATEPTHCDAHARLSPRGDSGRSGELAASIGILDLERAVFGCRGVQRCNPEVYMHRIRQPPSQDFARRPIHDDYRVEKAVLDSHRGDIGTPDLVRAVDGHLR